MIIPGLILGEPVVAAVSAPGETRWGFTQFPALSRLPDGRILLCYADAEDASETHGETAPSLVSSDDGAIWRAYSGEPDPVRPHYAITQGYDGVWFAIPSIRYFNVREAGIPLPEPVAESFVYGPLFTYRAADFPSSVRDHFRWLETKRWEPSEEIWVDGRVDYDVRNLLLWRRKDSDVLPRTFFERPATLHRGEIFYADYRVRYALDDGCVPKKGGTSLMVSGDNGRSFERRSVVGVDRSGRDLMGEPALAETSDGNLICVMRKTDHEQKPMCVTWSRDAGHTWDEPVEFCEFGVFPCLHKLKSGPLVLSYGRPGVHLRVSRDGTGREWSDPITLVGDAPGQVQSGSCGYTSLLGLSDDSLLMSYSDFKYDDEEGVRRKAILSRTVRIG